MLAVPATVLRFRKEGTFFMNHSEWAWRTARASNQMSGAVRLANGEGLHTLARIVKNASTHQSRPSHLPRTGARAWALPCCTCGAPTLKP